MRYVPSTEQETRGMLAAIGVESMDALYSDVPQAVLLGRPLNLPNGLSEPELMRLMHGAAGKNKVYAHCFMGAGAYRHYIPAIIDSLSSREEFVTTYTPYQAEMSQGILQSIFEYQTMICELMGMDVSNASVYDGATAAAEACLMAHERGRGKILVSAAANPQTVEVIRTYLGPLGMELILVDQTNGLTDMDDLKAKLDEETAGVYVASPNYYGLIEDVQAAADAAHAAGAKLICGMGPIAAALLKTPAEQGADIAVGDGQPLGLPLAFGGPYVGFMACREKLMRKMPGRIVGQTADDAGRRAFVLTLQAREQHIRREKAGSNICSNQAWCALRAAMYMSTMGRDGMREVAAHCYTNAHYLADELDKVGFKRVHTGEFFHEFATSCPTDTAALRQALDEQDILGGLPLSDGSMLWCATELNDKASVGHLIQTIRGVGK